MVYTKQTWTDGPGGSTPLSGARLNHIEDGIAAATLATVAPSAANVTVVTGVDATGATDVSTAVQAIIDGAPTNSRVYFPEGTYSMVGIQFNGGRSPVGAGRAKTVFQTAPNSTPTVALIRFTGSQVMHTTDITFQGNGLPNPLYEINSSPRHSLSRCYFDGQGGTCHGILFSGASNVHAGHYSDLHFTACGGSAIRADATVDAFDSQFANIWIGQCGVGIDMATGNGSTFWTNVHVWGCTGNGVTLGAGSCTFANFYFESNSGYGLYMTGAENSFVNGRVWRNALGGAYVTTGGRHAFTGVRFENNTGIGIEFASSNDWELVSCHGYNLQTPMVQTYHVKSSGASTRGRIVGGTFRSDLAVTDSFALVGDNYITPGTVTSTDRKKFGILSNRADTTANRPGAATVAAGSTMFDTTLGKPIWSNGSVWKDAAGTTV